MIKKDCLLLSHKAGKPFCKGIKTLECKANDECSFYKSKSELTLDEIKEYELMTANDTTPAKVLGYYVKG